MGRRVEAYAGTAGHSAWFSEDQGRTWVHPNSHSGMYLEARVWAFSSHPERPTVLWAGTDMGLFRWDEPSTRWTPVPSPLHDVWSVVQHPDDADLLIAGGRPAELYRSEDGGANWVGVPAPGMADFSPINQGPTRVTQILVDPFDRDIVWAAIEIGGIFRSGDRGKTWEARIEGLISLDVHGLAIIRRENGRRVMFATTNQGLHRSDDDGETWAFQKLDSPWQYTRAVVPRVDTDRILFLTNGNGPPGNDGKLLRSDDYGDSWHEVSLPGKLNSTVWCVATHTHDPMLLFACTNLGQLFRSRDGGDSWERMPHEFGELRALHWRWADIPEGRPAHSITVRK